MKPQDMRRGRECAMGGAEGTAADYGILGIRGAATHVSEALGWCLECGGMRPGVVARTLEAEGMGSRIRH